MWRRFLYNICNTCHWICDSWYCHVLSIIHFVSAFSFLHRIQGHTAYHLFLKGKTKTGKCHKNAFHTCQIQFSVLKFLLITPVMSPFGPSQSCNTLHYPKGWDKNPFQHGVFTGLSAAPETEGKWHPVLLCWMDYGSEWAAINLLHWLCEKNVTFEEWRRLHSVSAVKLNSENVQTTMTYLDLLTRFMTPSAWSNSCWMHIPDRISFSKLS